MFEALKGFRDVAELVKALKEYLSFKNKVLWEGTAAKGNTITVKNLSKYLIAEIYTRYGNGFINPQSGIIRISHGDHAGGTDDTPINGYVYGSINGDNVTISHCKYISHNPNSSHSVVVQMNIKKIVGIEPVIPESLKNYLGGGVLKVPIFLLGGGYHAVSKKVFKGCFEFRKISASNICWNELRTNRKAANAMGTFRDNIDRSRHKHGQKLWYKNSSICKTVFCCAQSVIRTRKFIKLFNVGWGTKRHGYKHGCINNSYPRSFNFNGVRLACDRRGKITDWRCCHV